ncbi:short chain dehydrogenase family protein [Mycobacterium xenopi 4042]|uniref:Short chain dehydrogenase family protein n=1 Tax=Mycobacterium xenopi 4042 TaxID=1299334 RepID=X8ARD1_MYCXE|nr:short chain dehydrogenase family protein [Mycobacterium xenopi 3993]EUA33340.1 short chain dehydrogenase family protein [Mycobacterium xenopi 4042]
MVITGGSGVIGRRYARHCIEHGARRLTLLSRKGLSSAQLDCLADGYAAEVHARGATSPIATRCPLLLPNTPVTARRCWSTPPVQPVSRRTTRSRAQIWIRFSPRE